MKFLAKKLVVPQLVDLEPYQSARRIGGQGQFYLNANESPFTPYAMPSDESWQRYPDFLPQELAKHYADYLSAYLRPELKLSSSKVIAVRGADEGIDLLIRTFCQSRIDGIRIQTPTYSMYEFIANAHQVAVEAIPLSTNFTLAMEENLKPQQNLKLIFICNPNNPTGNLLSAADILRIAEQHKDTALVVVDEAYSEFCPDESLVSEIASHPNLVILRTMSKAFGLAAIRIGFIVADESILEYVSTLIAPYPIPDPSAKIAIEALSAGGLQFMNKQRDTSLALKKKYMEIVAALPMVENVYPSYANFFLVHFQDSAKVFGWLRQHGIILRDQNRVTALKNHLRISIGSEQEMDVMINCLKEFS
ncbi:MAG TPA: histidinol-phosphate transaminase [Gammaproteobacteria bacterium]|nr:histidinol-phosphate transaminase [Gammaproteobacteria bacterium]